MKTTVIIAATIIFLAVPYTATAEQVTENDEISGEDRIEVIQDRREDRRENIQDRREDRRENIQDRREDRRENIQDRREDRRENIVDLIVSRGVV